MAQPLDWDQWRRDYDNLSYAEHQEFYERIYQEYPVQRHFNREMAQEFFFFLGDLSDLRVLELGGWDGELAVEMLDQFPAILSWFNFEICQSAVLLGQEHRRLWHHAPQQWFWEVPWPGPNVFFASHSLEHLSRQHLQRLLERVGLEAVDYLYVDVPLATDWTGYEGTHRLDCTREELLVLFAQQGFFPFFEQGSVIFFDR